MTLPELSVKRNVLALMISLVIVLFGALSLRGIGFDRIPNIDLPVINVSTSMSGADPQVIDTAVTEIIERRVNRVPGVQSIQSESSAGSSSINVIFGLGADVDVAFADVQSKVSEVLDTLPEDAGAPIVSKVSSSESPVLWLTLTGNRDLLDLSLYATRIIRPQIENVPGVAEVVFGGGQGRNIRIDIDPARLASQGVTISDVTGAIRREHVQLAGGYLTAGAREELIRLDLEYHDLLDLERLVLAERDGLIVRLRDVADVVDGLADQRRIARFNGVEAVGLAVVKVPGANTVAIVEEVRERLARDIIPDLAPGLELGIAYDEAVFITEQVDSLKLTILTGILFAALVIWIFMRNLRSTVIVSLSIPVSMMAAIAVLAAFGYTLNSVTMLALLLLVGVVVDDAIVVLESIYRHRHGRSNIEAAVKGSNEVFFAVVASTLALVSIFGAVVFLDAVIGHFFQSFAVVVTFGVAVSSLVALTLIPMLASRFIPSEDQPEGPVGRGIERVLIGLDEGYRRLLDFALRARGLVLAAVAVLIVGLGWLTSELAMELTPEEDVGQFVINLRAPLGSSLNYTEERLAEVEAHLATVPEIATTFASIGSGGGATNRASIFVALVDRGERGRNQQAIMADLQPQLAGFAGIAASLSGDSLLGGSRGEPLQFVVTGLDLPSLSHASEALLARLNQTPGMGRIEMDLSLDLPQLALEVDRERAAQLGVPADEIARTASVLIGGTNVARYNDAPGDGRRYNMRVKAAEGTFSSGDDLSRIYLRGSEGQMVRMDSVARFHETIGPAALARHDLRYATHFYASPELPLGNAIELLTATASEILPLGLTLQLTGEAEEMEKTISAGIFTLGLAVALVYSVLASQFNSFLQPLFIMLAQPLAIIGGVAGLWLGGYTLNIYSAIGLILLMGLVTKNGILLVDLTNRYRTERALAVDDALREACPIRLRPILMTSLTLLLALLPALIGVGAGAETNAPMAAAIIGGMVVSMLLTLVLLPVVYSLVEGRR